MFKEYFEESRIARIEKNIVDIPDELSMPKNLLGYEYLKTAVLIVTEDFESISAITKFIFPCAAKKHNTRTSLVESSHL